MYALPRSAWSTRVIVLYGVLVLVALAVAIHRLGQSMKLPGLGAIEVVLLALPWSLLLGVPPVAHAPLAANAIVVLLGLVINGALLAALAAAAERRWRTPRS